MPVRTLSHLRAPLTKLGTLVVAPSGLEADNTPTMANALLRLYDESHGIDVDKLVAPPLAGSEQERIAIWEDIWLDLRFDEEEPWGSSRLMEVAMPLSVSSGLPREMLSALFRVVGTSLAINSAYEFFVEHLWLPTRFNRERFGAARNCLPIPESLTTRQAYLVVRFWSGPAAYKPAEVRRIRQALKDQVLTRLGLIDMTDVSQAYSYVGPADIKASIDGKLGRAIQSPDDLATWVREQGEGEEVVATFVVDRNGYLRVAGRHSEHVACAGGQSVLSAGELTATSAGGVVQLSNQSTGYCPEPDCWTAVKASLGAAGISHPSTWSASFLFRLCKTCSQQSIIKDNWFRCEMCGRQLPRHWNF